MMNDPHTQPGTLKFREVTYLDMIVEDQVHDAEGYVLVWLLTHSVEAVAELFNQGPDEFLRVATEQIGMETPPREFAVLSKAAFKRYEAAVNEVHQVKTTDPAPNGLRLRLRPVAPADLVIWKDLGWALDKEAFNPDLAQQCEIVLQFTNPISQVVTWSRSGRAAFRRIALERIAMSLSCKEVAWLVCQFYARWAGRGSDTKLN